MAPTSPTSTATIKTAFWACTNFDDEELRFTWTIQNFSVRQEKSGTSITSPVLTSVSGLSWTLSLCPNGQSDTYKDYVSLYLNFSSSNDPDIRPEVKFAFTILHPDQHSVVSSYSLSYQRHALYHKFEGPGKGYGCPQFVKRNDLIEFLKPDLLTIRCEFTICGNRIDTSRWSNNILPVPVCTLTDDLGSSFRDQNAGDTIIEVDGKEFHVYKGILQARSSVFAAMFQHEMKEQIQNRVIIADFQAEVVEEMLIYIYTGKSPNLQAIANDLLLIADKYNLEGLKMMSAGVLSQTLTHENAVETLILADLHKISDLKKCVINFIITNSHFREASVWEKIVSSLSTKHPNLIAEVIGAFASKK